MVVWYLDLELHLESVYITTNVVSSNPVHDEVYSIQQYVIKFVRALRQVDGFFRVLWFPPPIKLKVAANTIPPPFINWVLVMVLRTQPTELSNACPLDGVFMFLCHNVGMLTTDDDDDVRFVPYQLTSVTLIRYDMVVNEHEKLSKITLRHRLK